MCNFFKCIFVEFKFNIIHFEKAHVLLYKRIFGLGKDAYHRLKRINPDEYNGASLLGLTAVVVKSHGSANVDAFARAIADAALQARLQIPQKILAGLQRY